MGVDMSQNPYAPRPSRPGFDEHPPAVTAPPQASRRLLPSNASRRGIGALLRDLSRETTTLLRDEAALARAELGEKLDHFTSGAAELAGGLLLAFAGFMVLLGAAVFGLAEVMPLWASSLLVGAVVLGIGVLLFMRARSQLAAERLTPERTLESLRRDADLARDEAQRVREQAASVTDAGPTRS
jgi:hypothetical protein